jgi:HPr Serine kinase C-terminal domain
VAKAQSTIESLWEETQAWPRDPLQYYVEFPFHEIYYPLGLPLEVSTNSASVIAAAQQSWGPFPELQSAKKIHLRIGVAQRGSDELPHPPVFRAQRGLITIIADSENFGVCDVTSGFGFGWVTPVTAADSPFFRYHFLDVMIGLLLSPIHFAIVHAACVALDGHGVLLCGHSKAGKSTLAFACAQRGWTFISDDVGYVSRKNPGRMVIGNPLYLRLREDAPELFPQLRDRAVGLRQNGEPGFEISTSSLPNFATAFKCEIEHIVFLRRSASGPARLSALSKDHARLRLENVLEYTLACKGPSSNTGSQSGMVLADLEARQEQKAAIGKLLTAEVHELYYSNLDSAIDCLESAVPSGT